MQKWLVDVFAENLPFGLDSGKRLSITKKWASGNWKQQNQNSSNPIWAKLFFINQNQWPRNAICNTFLRIFNTQNPIVCGYPKTVRRKQKPTPSKNYLRNNARKCRIKTHWTKRNPSFFESWNSKKRKLKTTFNWSIPKEVQNNFIANLLQG